MDEPTPIAPGAPRLTLLKRGDTIRVAFTTEHSGLPAHVGTGDAPWLSDTLLAMAACPGAVEAYARALRTMADPAVPDEEAREFAVPGGEGDAGTVRHFSPEIMEHVRELYAKMRRGA